MHVCSGGWIREAWGCTCVPSGALLTHAEGTFPSRALREEERKHGAPDRNHSFALLSLGLEENEACCPFLPNEKQRIDFSSLLIVHIQGLFLGKLTPRSFVFTAQTFYGLLFPLRHSPGWNRNWPIL